MGSQTLVQLSRYADDKEKREKQFQGVSGTLLQISNDKER